VASFPTQQRQATWNCVKQFNIDQGAIRMPKVHVEMKSKW